MVLFGLWILRDYHAWKDFGTGGTPPTWAGYLKMTKIRLHQLFSGHDMRDVSPLGSEGPSHLHIALPDRSASRPTIQSRTMPQRQFPATLDPDVQARLHGLPRKLCSQYSDLLRLDLSHTEGKSSDGIYARDGLPRRNVSATDRILQDEIAHVHPAENSLHVWLSQADARKVVSTGWGER
jgi:hypothetical protein